MTDLELYEEYIYAKARENFWFFRKVIHQDLKVGWWQKEMAQVLQTFYEDMKRGRRPKLAISAPPQHGKSMMITDFIAWTAGKNPSLKTIYASYSERLGVRANLSCQRIFCSEKYARIFKDTKLSDGKDQNYIRTREFLEYIDQEGSFRNTTVEGAITGETLDFGVIDDPIKGRKDSNSLNKRDSTWDWFVSDFFSRFSEDAAFLTIATRWHVDDPIGRMMERFGNSLKIVSHEAIAEQKGTYRDVGDALFPTLKSKEFLLERKGVMSSVEWQSLYQGNPITQGGNLIKGGWFVRYTQLPKLKYRCVYADTAQKTKEHNDFSVFQVWGAGEDGKAYLIDQIRGKWEAPDLKIRAVDFWRKHKAATSYLLGDLRQMKVEDKSSGTGLIQEIKRVDNIPITPIERNKDKYTRVLDVLGYIEASRVCLPDNAHFLSDFILECEQFSADGGHKHDDQVDPMVDAIFDMLANNSLDIWERLI